METSPVPQPAHAPPSALASAIAPVLAFAVEPPLLFVAGLAVSFVTRLIEEKDATKALDRLAEHPFSGWAVRLPVMAAAVRAAWTLLSLA